MIVLPVVYEGRPLPDKKTGWAPAYPWHLCNKHHLRPCHYGCTLYRPLDRPITDEERRYLATLGLLARDGTEAHGTLMLTERPAKPAQMPWTGTGDQDD